MYLPRKLVSRITENNFQESVHGIQYLRPIKGLGLERKNLTGMHVYLGLEPIDYRPLILNKRSHYGADFQFWWGGEDFSSIRFCASVVGVSASVLEMTSEHQDTSWYGAEHCKEEQDKSVPNKKR
jgi:hypothetical protein